MESFQESIANFTEPLIKFSGYTFLYGDKLDCKNAPTGINITYINKSIIPIKFKGKMRISYGDVYFSDAGMEINKSDKFIIIPPGSLKADTYLRKEFSLLLNKKI